MPYQPAVLGKARLNNFRLNYLSAGLRKVREAKIRIWIAGADATARVRVRSVEIRDVLNDAPNGCSLTVEGTAPQVGYDLRITVNANTPRVLFHGTFQTVELGYEGRVHQSVWRCTAVDDIARANIKRPFGNYVSVSATAIAQDLMARYAPGFTVTHVQAGLPAVSVTFDGADTVSACLKRLATLVGGYYYFEDLDLHFYQTETAEAPDPITVSYPFAAEPPIVMVTDLSQIRTRVYGKGHGESCLADLLAGETIVPIADSVMFNPAGGQAMAATTREGAQHQKLTYTGITAGGVGSLIGPGVTPSAAMTVAGKSGAGIESGVHQYAYTWVTATGETPPGPVAAFTHGTVAGPTKAPLWQYDNDTPTATTFAPGDTVEYCYTYGLKGTMDLSVAGLHTAPSPIMAHVAVTSTAYPGQARTITLFAYFVNDARVKLVYLYRRVNGSTWAHIFTTTNDLVNPAWPINNDGTTVGTVMGSGLPTPSAVVNQTTISGVGVGPSGTTSRKVYRTIAGGAQLKLQQTIANNTATVGVDDATPDASLGANAPTADTSGISTVSGQVNAGSATMPTASPAPFSAAGGWAMVSGGQVIRYTGVSGNSLTGIPASGPGALQTTVVYGSPVTAAPSLTGVTGLALAMEAGSAIHVWVQEDDVPAQNAMIALDAAQGRTSDGVYEYIISDERRGEASLRDLCRADLALFSRPIITVRYATRDQKTHSGRPVAINLTAPPMVANLVIQDVTITDLEIAEGLSPKYAVSASSVRFSVEDLLRQLAVAAGGNA